MRGVTATATVLDIAIGLADGLTVPFALAAGLSGVGAPSGIVVTAGLAEIARVRARWDLADISQPSEPPARSRCK